MTDQAIYFNNAQQVIPVFVQFTKADGITGTVPAAVVCTVTDPYGTATVYTYNPVNVDPNAVLSDGAGEFHLFLMPFGVSPPAPPAGLWTYTWTGVGGLVANGAQVFAGTFRVLPLTTTGSGFNVWYFSKEELKSRLEIAPTDTKDDYEIQLVAQTVTDWITTYCGRHFYRITETRTFEPRNVWTMDIDDIVTATSVDLDYDGDGVYETHWTENQQYQLMRYEGSYNLHDLGISRPRNYLQVLQGATNSNPTGGQWLPWIVPFTPRNRVSITGVWGWQDVPPNVAQAALYIAAEMFKAKDSPFGVAGIGELGLVKIQASPWVVELLRPYINVKKKVGV